MAFTLTPLQRVLAGLCLLSLMAHYRQHAGWLIMALAYLPLYYHYHRLRSLQPAKEMQYFNGQNIQDQSIRTTMVIMLVIVTLHCFLGYCFSHEISLPLPFHDLDSYGYHFQAVAYADSDAHWFYADFFNFFNTFMHIIYSLVYPSWFFSTSAMVVCFAMALVLFDRMLCFLKVAPMLRWASLLLLGLMPQNLIWSSASMREGLVLLLLMTMIWPMLTKPQVTNWTKTNTFWFLVSLVLLVQLHSVTCLLALLCLAAGLIQRIPVLTETKKFIALGLSITALIVLFIPLTQNQSLFELFQRYLIDFSHGSGAFVGQTNYQEALRYYPKSSDFLSFTSHVIKLYGHYLFGPYPWELSQFPQALAKMGLLMMFGMMRLLMIGCILLCYQIELPAYRPYYIGLLTYYTAITFLFSLGTFNYMQGLRHHMLSDWLLLLLFARGMSHLMTTSWLRDYFDKNQVKPCIDSRNMLQ